MTSRNASTVRPISLDEASPVLGSADVVIVGFGAAGAAAAIEAARIGASVLVLERAGGPGGAAAQAGGIIYLGGGTPTQIGAGISDSAEAMETYLLAACGPEPDTAKISAYVQGNLEHHQFFVDCGVEFEPSLCETVQMESPGTEGLVWSGGENAYPFNQLTKPAPRGHLARTKGATGWLLMEKLHDAALSLGVNVEYDLRVERLVLNGDRVVGVEATRFGVTGTFLASGGVVVAAGGFIHNEEMLAAEAPSVLAGNYKVGTSGDDGRGIQMLLALGARTKSMHAGECSLPVMPPKKLTEGIIVDRKGQRFINEDTYNGRIGQRALYNHDAMCFLIVDEAAYSPTWLGLEATAVCATVEELETEGGFVPGSLKATIDLYNHHASSGSDPVFHKDPAFVRPLVGPLGLMELRSPNIPYAVFTLGGVVTTVDGEVVDVDGRVIPGCFAAGRTTSGICSFGYASGLSIGDSTFFGRLAGKAAAQLR